MDAAGGMILQLDHEGAAAFGPRDHQQTRRHLDHIDVDAARAELEAKGVEFVTETFDSGVCHQAIFLDPAGNALEFKAMADPAMLFAKN